MRNGSDNAHGEHNVQQWQNMPNCKHNLLLDERVLLDNLPRVLKHNES